VFVVDTNVLVYASNRDGAEYERCRELVEGWRTARQPWHATWSIFYEFLRVVTHARVLPRPYTTAQAWRFLEAILAAPSFQLLLPTKRHADVLGKLLSDAPAVTGSIVHDAHNVALMREHGIRRIYTRDTDLKRFPDIEVIDPLGPLGPLAAPAAAGRRM